jgi:hypothetical protein
MANRFPLTLDGTTIKELPSGDNLDLTGSSISISGSQGTDGQVLTSTGSGIAWEDAASGGGGGAWTLISTSTVTSSLSSVEISLSGYTEYVLRYFGVNLGTTNRWVNIYMTTSGGSYSESLMFGRTGYGSNISSTTSSSNQSTSYIHAFPGGTVNSTNGNAFGTLNITNVPGQPVLYGMIGTADEHASNGAGFQHLMARYVSPGSSDTIAKIKFDPDSGSLQAGTFVLYGLSTS